MSAIPTEWDSIGEHVRVLRLRSGLTVRELARRVGVSASHISQVERGIGAFSVPTLYAVAGELGVSMNDLLAPEGDEPGTTVPALPVRASDEPDMATRGFVQRAADHPTIALSSGPRWARLTTNGESDAEFLEVIYAPGTEAPAAHIHHQGREYGVIITGDLSVEVDGEITTLHPGDAIAFDSALPHRFWNAGDDQVRAIWFVRGRDSRETLPHG